MRQMYKSLAESEYKCLLNFMQYYDHYFLLLRKYEHWRS